MEISCCSWCEPSARNLTQEACQMLSELEKIPPAFSVWSEGRREESGEAPQQNANMPVPQPAEISPLLAPGLFLGDLDDVYNVMRLRELGIGFVLNLCPERLEGYYADLPARLVQEGIKHLAWPAKDSSTFNIIEEVVNQGACDFIEMGLRSAGVLVNCWGGVNRSAAVAVAFPVLRRNLALVDAVRQVMNRRGTVLTNQTFRYLLVQVALAAHPKKNV